jgi:hypothetical protein
MGLRFTRISCDTPEDIVACFSRNRPEVPDVRCHFHDTTYDMTLFHAWLKAICGFHPRISRGLRVESDRFNLALLVQNANFVSEGAEQISATLDAQTTAQPSCEETLPEQPLRKLSL